jgi:archaellum component FlaC
MMEALKMESPMDKWNDARLDELAARVDEGFSKVDERFDKVDERFAGVASKGELKEVKNELRNLSGRIDRLLHAFAVVAVTFGIGVLATLGGVVVALL